MSVAESVVEKLQTLTPEQQREVAELVDALAAKSNATKTPRRSLLGLCADLGIKITEEDIADARKEMWGNFPRDF
jgi:uncharacterized protein with von Willebrand factor type A (vWA) domain